MSLSEEDTNVLLQKFLHFATVEARDDLVEKLKEFQEKHRGALRPFRRRTGTVEQQHGWAELHCQYVEIVEGIAQKFCKLHDLDEENFVQIIGLVEKREPKLWLPFQALINRSDYSEFIRCLADGICLCCGATLEEEETHTVPAYAEDVGL